MEEVPSEGDSPSVMAGTGAQEYLSPRRPGDAGDLKNL